MKTHVVYIKHLTRLVDIFTLINEVVLKNSIDTQKWDIYINYKIPFCDFIIKYSNFLYSNMNTNIIKLNKNQKIKNCFSIIILIETNNINYITNTSNYNTVIFYKNPKYKFNSIIQKMYVIEQRIFSMIDLFPTGYALI